MSTSDETVAQDYGLDPTPVSKAGAPERRIWETTTVVPDPHRAGYFYVTQKLSGEWKRRPASELAPYYTDAMWARNPDAYSHPQVRVTEEKYEEIKNEVLWKPRKADEPPVTRVLYCTFDEKGVMQNVNKDASQGKFQAGTIYVTNHSPAMSTEDLDKLADLVTGRIKSAGGLL